MIRIAIAKGRILTEAVDLLGAAGFDVSALQAESRSLIRPLGNDIEAMIVRSQDVPLFVSRGACALGITGIDTLRERRSDLHELLDLGIGACRMSVAGPRSLDFHADPTRRWRVATKYPVLTAEAFERAGRYYDLVVMGGTLETAPEAGIADCIVDLVETGKTLAAHDLIVYEEIMSVTSRLICEPSAFYRQRDEIRVIVDRIMPVVGGAQ